MESIIRTTPLIKIWYKYNDKNRYVFAKLEYYNITGSIKDRVAYYILKNAKQRGELKERMPIIEATSGNTGISLAALGSYYKHPVYIYMPDWVSQERLNLMKMYNANVTLISKEQGGFSRCIEEAKKKAKEVNGYIANQFGNKDNVLAHFETTGEEIVKQMDGNVGGFIAGIGTGGTLMGVAKRIKKSNKNTSIVALEPEQMPMLSQNKILGPHEIEGIGDEFIPPIVEKQLIDDVVLINDQDAINMARLLATKLGLGVGISSGANMLGAIMLEEKINKNVVTTFADDNKKYISTKLSEPVEKNNNFLSNKIELLDYEIVC